MLLHCALTTSSIWSPIIAGLSRDYRTYAVDVMGDIGRTVPTNPPETYPEFGQWLVEVYRELGIESARVLGWSFGGFVATNFAVHEPQRVEKLAAGALSYLCQTRSGFSARISSVCLP